MRAREILRAAYGNSRNICTPHIVRVGKVHPRIAYELSVNGRDDLWGVTLVRWEPEYQKAIRLYEHSRAFPSRAEAEAYIEGLRDQVGELLAWQDPYSY
jgi:hypothetical protein